MLKQLIKEILSEELIVSEQTESEKKKVSVNPFLGKPVLIRHHKMGVNTGILLSHDSENFYLKNSRKVWRWAPKKSIALESLAVNGPDPSRTRATAIALSVAIPKNEHFCGMILLSDNVFDEIQSLVESEQS